ncbi:MAG: molybdopterin molybdotransferase MoeA [Anaerolineae bacterium]
MVESAFAMISPQEAYEIVVSSLKPLPAVDLPIDEALGLALAAEIRATENMPPFPSSAMDGYAVVASDESQERLILGEQDAGQAQDFHVRPGAAVRIMTGAPLPEGADSVIPVEFSIECDGYVRFSRTLRAGANVRPVGQDIAAGQVVLAAGQTLGAAEIGLLAAVGTAHVHVHPHPRVAVMATGDELVGLGKTPGPGQIRDSNSHALAALVRQMGAEPVVLGAILDREESLERALLEGLRRADIVLTSGGVSMGRRDLIKPLLERLGEIKFGRVAQKPGKPTTFALVHGKAVFGLPGFPVSSLVSAELYVRPAVRRLGGHALLRRPEITVRLGHAIRHDPDRTEYQRVVVTWENGEAVAHNTGDQVSGRLLSLVGANALAILPQGVSDLAEGERVPALLIG